MERKCILLYSILGVVLLSVIFWSYIPRFYTTEMTCETIVNKAASSEYNGQDDVTKEMMDRSVLQRRIKEHIVELWRATQYELHKVAAVGRNALESTKRLRQRYHALILEVEDLEAFDRPWKLKLANKTREVIINKITKLQNPRNCDKTGQFYVPVSKCGFGCSYRHLTRCMEISMANNMTLIADYSTSLYKLYTTSNNLFPFKETSTCPLPTNLKNWTEFVCHISKCAPRKSFQVVEDAPQKMSNYSKVFLKKEFLSYPVGFKPPGVSDQMWSTISIFSGSPRAWWNRLIQRYLLSPREDMNSEIQDAVKLVNFSKPIVGVHVRRSDKLTSPGEDSEAHDLSEYMGHVADWYDKYVMRMEKENQGKLVERRVYLATDEPMIWNQTTNYPGYIFLGKKEFSATAQSMRRRNSITGMRGVAIDVMMLAKCDFIVGTFTSAVTTLAYELHQHEMNGDYDDIASLDIDYGEVNYPNKIHVTMLPHSGDVIAGDIELKQGDIVYTDSNLWNGLYRGVNSRTGEKGTYPTYKVKDSTVYYEDVNKNMLDIFHFDVVMSDYGTVYRNPLEYKYD